MPRSIRPGQYPDWMQKAIIKAGGKLHQIDPARETVAHWNCMRAKARAECAAARCRIRAMKIAGLPIP